MSGTGRILLSMIQNTIWKYNALFLTQLSSLIRADIFTLTRLSKHHHKRIDQKVALVPNTIKLHAKRPTL